MNYENVLADCRVFLDKAESHLQNHTYVHVIAELVKIRELLDNQPEIKAGGAHRNIGMDVACKVLNIIFFKVPAVHGKESGKWWAAELQDKNIPVRWDEKSGEFRPSN